MKTSLHLRHRTAEVDKHPALAHAVDPETLRLQVSRQRRDVGSSRSELGPNCLRRQPLVVLGIAVLMQRHHRCVERRLPLLGTPQHKLNMLHRFQRVACSQVHGRCHLAGDRATRGRQSASIHGSRDQRPRRKLDAHSGRRILRGNWKRKPHRKPAEHDSAPSASRPRTYPGARVGGSATVGEGRQGKALMRGGTNHNPAGCSGLIGGDGRPVKRIHAVQRWKQSLLGRKRVADIAYPLSKSRIKRQAAPGRAVLVPR